jgi:hypothetical protein
LPLDHTREQDECEKRCKKGLTFACSSSVLPLLEKTGLDQTACSVLIGERDGVRSVYQMDGYWRTQVVRIMSYWVRII